MDDLLNNDQILEVSTNTEESPVDTGPKWYEYENANDEAFQVIREVVDTHRRGDNSSLAS